jgi:large subunit ribosomal protein L4e
VKRVPHAVKGRRAHPPKPQKKAAERINKKEHQRALSSAFSMSAQRDIVCNRAHTDIGVSLPVVLEDGFENIGKTKDVAKVLKALNLIGFVEKSKQNGTKSVLIVISDSAKTKGGANLPGVDVRRVGELKVRDLAPGTHGGRLTLYTEKALPEIEKRCVL